MKQHTSCPRGCYLFIYLFGMEPVCMIRLFHPSAPCTLQVCVCSCLCALCVYVYKCGIPLTNNNFLNGLILVSFFFSCLLCSLLLFRPLLYYIYY